MPISGVAQENDPLSAILGRMSSRLVACVMEAYFDESATGPNDPVMGVAGYLFEPQEAALLDTRWKAVLAEHQLEYFRMSECQSAYGQFKGRTYADCDIVARKLIAIIKQHALCGVMATVEQRVFDGTIADIPSGIRSRLGGSYTLCVVWCIAALGRWLEENRKGNESIYYRLEEGHSSQGEASSALDCISKHPELRGMYRYGNHGFLGKKEAAPLQAADMLAWEWRRAGEYALTRPEGKVRGSLLELLRDKPSLKVHFGRNQILLQAAHLEFYTL